MAFSPVITTVAETISTAIAPVFLLAGIGAILNVLAGRLSRIVDRVRALEMLHPASSGPEHERHVWELRLLDRRITLINNALFLCVISGILICSVVALLFVAVLSDLHLGQVVAVAFITSMLLLIGGLSLFLVEVRVSVHALHVRDEFLERSNR
tara:strand:+ start:349 stop:810 length:462 start_codon:yes stop_codon:yes gene_type:complete